MKTLNLSKHGLAKVMLTTFCLFTFGAGQMWAGQGYNDESHVYLNVDGTTKYYKVSTESWPTGSSLPGTWGGVLKDQTFNNVLNIQVKGGAVGGWTENGGNISGTLYYKVTTNTTTPSSGWTSVGDINANYTTKSGNNCFRYKNDYSVNVTPTTPGTYYLHIKIVDGASNNRTSYVKIVVPSFTVAGTTDVLGSYWDVTDTNNDMTFSSGTTYTLTKSNVTLSTETTYECKVALNHSWTTSYPNSNKTFTVNANGHYNVTFTFNASTQAVDVSTTRLYAVIYNDNGKTSGSVPATSYHANGATVTVASNSGSLAKTGYSFGGWNTNASGTGTNYTAGSGTFTMGTSDKNLYAKWTENTHQVKVSATTSPTSAGTSPSPSSWTAFGEVTGGNISITANTGYTFSTWTILPGGAGTFDDATSTSTKFYPTKDSELKATFTPKSYTVILDKNGGTSDGSVTTTYNSDITASFSGASRAGYSTDGYYTDPSTGSKIIDADGNLVSGTVSGWLSSGYWVKDAATITLYPHWTEDVTYYTLNFGVRSGQSSYGSVTAKNSSTNAALTNGKTYISGTGVTVTATPDDDYKLTGWYNAASGGSVISSAGTNLSVSFSLNANTKYYAAFAQKSTTITLNNTANGGSGGTTSKTINHGASMSELTAPGKSGYTFTGWWTSDSGGSKVIAADGTLVASVTVGGVAYTTSGKKWDYDDDALILYAQYTENMTTVTINVSPTGAGTLTVGGSAFTAGNTTTAGKTTSRTVVATAGSDYVFNNWTVSGEATGTASTNTYTLKGSGNGSTGTLTANFTAISCNLYKLSAAKNGSTTDKGAMTYDNTEHAYYKDVTTDASPYYFRFYYNSSTQYCSDWKDKYDGGYTSGKEIVANGSKVDCDQTVSSWTNKPAMYYSGASGTAIRIWFDYQNKKVWITEQTYAVTINNGDHGTVSPNGSQQIGGSGLQITATPASGYKFDSWTKTGSVTLSSTTTNPTTVSATGTGTVTANYSLIWAILGSQATNTTTGTDGFGGWSTSNTNALLGNISTSGGKTYGYVELTLEANKNYQFKIYDRQNNTWYGNGGDNVYYMTSASCSNWEFGTDKSYNCGITTTGAGTYRFTWNLTDKKLTVTYPTSYAVNFAVIPSAAANAVTTDVTGLTTGGYVASGTSVTFTHQTAKTGYTWTGWYNNAEGTGTALGTDNTYTAASITQNTDVYAVYTEKEYNVKVSAGAGGTVSPSGTVAVKQISGTTLTATPNAGYAFNGWTKSGSNITLTPTSTNPTTAKATAAGGTVTANFVEDWYIYGDKPVMGSWATEWSSGKLTADGDNFSITLNLAANTTYEFKLYKKSGDNHYWSNSTDISGKTKSASNVALYYDDGNNMSITTAIAGEYKFTLSDVSSDNPKLEIDFPSALQIYRSTPTHSEVIATHAWDSNTGGSVYRKTLTLNGNTTYEFKIYDGGEYYTHGTKITTSISNRNFSNSGSDCQLETKSAGSFIFDWDRSSKALTVHYPQSAIVEATPDKVYSGSTVTFTGYASELGSGSHTVKYEFFKGTTLTADNKVAELTKTETATHQQVTTDPITVTFDGNTTSQVYTLRVTSDGVVRGTNTCTVYRKWDIYVHDVASWNAMYYYVYNADGSHRDTWPGYDYSDIKYNGNATWYSVALDAQYPYFILDNNEGIKQLKGDQAYATDITTFTPGSFWYVAYDGTYTTTKNDGKSYYDLTQINLTDPTVTLDAPEVVSGTMAYFTGTVTNFGYDGMSAQEMREVGVYIGDTKYTTTCYGTDANKAKFYLVVDGLTAGTTYSARAFALNAHGEGKSAAQSFTTRAHNTYTIKVRASSTPYIYAWSYKADPNGCGAKTEQNRAWPGVAMTSTGVTGAQGTWYEYTMDNTYNQFKVTTGASSTAYDANQTGEWVAPMEDKCYWYWNGTEKASHGNQTMGEMTCPYLTPQLMIETTAGNSEYAYHEMTGTGTVSYSIPLAAETTYKFKIVNNSDWYTNNETFVYPEACSSISFSVLDGSGNECQIGTTYGGTYIFIYNTTDNTLSVTYPTLPNVIGTVGLGATGALSGSGTSANPYIVFAGKNLTLLTTHLSAPAADSHFKYTYYKGDSELATKLSTATDAKQYALEVGSVAGTYTAKVSAYYEYGLTGHTAKGTAKEATIYYKVIDIPTPTLTLSPATKVQLGNSVTLTGSVTNETGVAVSSTAWSFLTGTASGSVTTAVSTNSTSSKTHTPTAVGTQYYKAVLNMWGETLTSAEQSITVYVPITVQSNNNTYGTITSATSIEYSSGNATIQATKKTGYKFSVWQATEGITIANPKSRNTTFTATQAGTITAVFKPDYGSRWFIRGVTDHNLSDDATTLSWSTDLDEINDDKFELTKESYDGNIAYAYLNFNHDASTGQSVQFKLYNSEAASNKWRGNKTTIVRTATIDYPVNSDVEGNTTLAVTVPGTYTFALDLTTYKLTVTYPEVNLVRGSWDGFVFSNEMTAGTGDESHIYSWSIDASSLSAFTDYTFFIVNDGNQLFSPQTGVSINHNNNKVGLLACDTTSYHFGFKTTTADVSTTTGTRGKYVFHYNTVTKQVTIDYPDLKTPKDITITVKAIQTGTNWWDAVGFHIWGTNGGDDDGDYEALWVTDKTEGGVNYKYFYYTFHTNGSINFTINKWNTSGSSIYLDGTNQTGDITNVTADHCYTILQSPANDYGGHKGYHTDEGSCVPLLYKVKTTLTDGTVYYSNEGTQDGDTLSFYATTTTVNATKYKRNGTTVLQKMTSSGWQTLQTLNTTQIKESNVYYGVLNTSGGNLTNITKYEGDYYVLSPTTTVAQDFRTDAWGSDEKSNAVMTYFPPSENYVDTYRYYHVNWLEGNTVKLKGQVANEYNANLAQYEDIQEPYTTADGKSADEKGVNLRFSYDPETNVFKRTFLAGASDRPNFLTMYDDSLNLKMLNKTDLITKEEPIRYSDGTNWLYMVDSYATIETNKATPHVVLVANFNGQDQYLFEKDEKGIPYNRRLYQKNLTTPGTYKTRVIYDYKTNRIISAWLIDTNTQISSDINLYDNVLFRRINNDPIKNMDIAAANKVAQVNMIYTELEIQRDGEDGWKSLFATGGDGVARYGFYWFSLPYECYVEDIMGLGGKYGEKWYILRYRGDKRAQSGWYLDNNTFWERLSPHGLMKPGEGYVVAVNLAVTDFKEVKVHSSKWVEGQAPDSTVASLRIFFPSDFYYVHTEIKDTNSVYQTVPVHECNIPARRIYDSNWNVIGVPSLEPLTFSSATGDYVYDNETNTAGNPTFVYEWEWHKEKAAAGNYGSGNSFTYTLKSAAGMTFLPTFSYMTQYAGTITWNKNYSSVSQWGSSYGAPQKHNEQKPYRRMELSLRNTDNDELDNTFVYLQDGATDDYDLNLDIVKIFNDGAANFYSLGAYYETTDQNGNPMTDHVEFGGNVLPVKNTVVPLGIRAERQETMTITLSNKEMIKGVVPVLYDKEQDRYTNLLTADYTFSLDRLTLEDRLFLNLYLNEEDIPDGILTDNAVANNDEQYSITAVDGGIIINGINGSAFVRMYDPTGRLMFSGQVEQGQLLNVPVQQAFILNVDGTVVKAVRK